MSSCAEDKFRKMIYQLPNTLSFHFLYFHDVLEMSPPSSASSSALPTPAPHPASQFPPAAVTHRLQISIRAPGANTLISTRPALFAGKMELIWLLLHVPPPHHHLLPMYKKSLRSGISLTRPPLSHTPPLVYPEAQHEGGGRLKPNEMPVLPRLLKAAAAHGTQRECAIWM